MPNLKIFLDDSLPDECRSALREALSPIRDMLCRQLKVDRSACQFAILPVIAINGQPPINVELSILPKPDRSREVILGLCGELQRMVAEVSGTHVAVRASALDPETYVALK
ncbi:hypothetical protein QA646_28685 (plasmid) [Rhizobium sp. CB3090]|uniref:hypothetical protein n=1 Tax=Rhizobium sp. CB3090 TaxID=3039156 RepID=UPI0024B26A67|nr:hypothetical protein [Rhizobium sp. CB3090]WFU12868.1 hypothetical protein QA646_28685 [Rhizobium sp. CB3090]